MSEFGPKKLLGRTRHFEVYEKKFFFTKIGENRRRLDPAAVRPRPPIPIARVPVSTLPCKPKRILNKSLS